MELGVEEFAVVKGVGDVLAGHGAGCYVFFGVKGVGDVLAGHGAGCGRVLWSQGRR